MSTTINGDKDHDNGSDEMIPSGPGDLNWQARFEEIRANKLFKAFIIAIIMTSALLVGVKTYDVSPLVLRIVEWLDFGVTVIFVIELTIRFLGEAQNPDR